MTTGAGDDHITAHLATLQQLAGDLEDILKQLNGRLDDLYDRVTRSCCPGGARPARCSSTSWRSGTGQPQDLQAAQKWLHEVVTTGHTNYAAAHRAVLRGWGAA